MSFVICAIVESVLMVVLDTGQQYAGVTDSKYW